MQNIESCPHPAVFRVADGSLLFVQQAQAGDTEIPVRVAAMALTGMQKQALVHDGASNIMWRMLCDEGPYLHGTDLAPFPLAYFTTGLALSILGEIEALAAARGIGLSGFSLILDNWYSMHGSALNGTMAAGALPPEILLQASSEAGATTLTELIADAMIASPANALLRSVLASRFTITHNAEPLQTERVMSLQRTPLARPQATLESARPAAPECYAANIIRKLSCADTVFGVEGGAGSSLQAEQERYLHVRGIASRRQDGLYQVDTQLFKPIGSVFRCIGDACSRFGGRDRAPSAHAYLCAGIAFCYLTQIGRFAHINKQRLDHFSLVQDTRFSLPGASGHSGRPAWAKAVETHVHVDSPETPETIQQLIDMGEQTCFLHAACRTPLKARIHLPIDAQPPVRQVATWRRAGIARHAVQLQA